METENIFVKGLNSPQKQAVLYCDGPSLVIAGAGSGKTRVLTHKIAYLISMGMDPHRIMALTFTNKAAAEMKERIDTLLGYNASQALWMGTFHSIFGRMLRIEADKIGFTSNFTIYDTDDQQRVGDTIHEHRKLSSRCGFHLIMPLKTKKYAFDKTGALSLFTRREKRSILCSSRGLLAKGDRLISLSHTLFSRTGIFLPGPRLFARDKKRGTALDPFLFFIILPGRRSG